MVILPTLCEIRVGNIIKLQNALRGDLKYSLIFPRLGKARELFKGTVTDMSFGKSCDLANAEECLCILIFSFS